MPQEIYDYVAELMWQDKQLIVHTDEADDFREIVRSLLAMHGGGIGNSDAWRDHHDYYDNAYIGMEIMWTGEMWLFHMLLPGTHPTHHAREFREIAEEFYPSEEIEAPSLSLLFN